MVGQEFAYIAYTRTQSYFENSELAAKGLPSPDELKLLEPLSWQNSRRTFHASVFKLPVTDGSGDNRDNLRKAADLLKEAGWTLKNGVLTNAQGPAFYF